MSNQKQLGDRIRGDANPMRRPEVAAKVAARLRERLANDLAARAAVERNLAKGRDWTPERREAVAASVKAAWTEEMRAAARARSTAYQERVKAALAASPVKV